MSKTIRQLPSKRWYWEIPDRCGETGTATGALFSLSIWSIRKKIGGNK